jgi:hypothetical protein
VRDGSREELLKEILVKVATKHFHPLLELDHGDDFLGLVDDEPEFGKNLIEALLHQSERRHSVCKDCHLV